MIGNFKVLWLVQYHGSIDVGGGVIHARQLIYMYHEDWKVRDNWEWLDQCHRH